MAFHSDGGRGRSRAKAVGLATPLEPESLRAVQVSKDLVSLPLSDVLASGLRLWVSCGTCGHRTVWTRELMEIKLGRLRSLTMIRVAMRLRCGRCGSSSIHIGRA